MGLASSDNIAIPVSRARTRRKRLVFDMKRTTLSRLAESIPADRRHSRKLPLLPNLSSDPQDTPGGLSRRTLSSRVPHPAWRPLPLGAVPTVGSSALHVSLRAQERGRRRRTGTLPESWRRVEGRGADQGSRALRRVAGGEDQQRGREDGSERVEGGVH
eukprot:2006581-Rhodomonas_salina.2